MEQRKIYDAIVNSVEQNPRGIFFVYGSGGIGKTYLWRTLIEKYRSDRKIVLAVASSGIASLLLPRGRTAHSRFKIPLLVDENSCCDISVNINLAMLIRRASLIIWDEAPMIYRNELEAVDRTTKDLMQSLNPDLNNRIFGGKIVLLGGNFRKILPLITDGYQKDDVGSTVNRYPIWNHCQIF